MEKAALVAEIEVEALEKNADPIFGVRFKATSRLLQVLRTADRKSTIRSGDVITIAGPGGELAETGVYLTGFPRPYRGRRYRAYLNPAPGKAAEYTVVGFEQGFRPLDTTDASRTFTRNRTDGSNGDGTGPFLYWDDSFFPIPYYFALPGFRNVPQYVPAIDASLNTWRRVEGTRHEFLPMGCTDSNVTGNDGVNQMAVISQGWDLDPLAIAVTRNYYISGNSARTGLIMDSDVLLNAQNYTLSTDGTPGTHDVQNILTHESGHLLGLGHEIDPIDSDGTMYAWASPNEYNKRTLHPNDVAGIVSAYPGTGNRFPGDIMTTNCSLGKPGSCLVVHGKPAPKARDWALFMAGIIALLAGGRLYARKSLTSAS